MKKKDENKPKLKLLNIDYFKYRTKLTKKFEERTSYKEKDPRQVLAFIPGTIRKISVKDGDAVKNLYLLKIKGRKFIELECNYKNWEHSTAAGFHN